MMKLYFLILFMALLGLQPALAQNSCATIYASKLQISEAKTDFDGRAKIQLEKDLGIALETHEALKFQIYGLEFNNAASLKSLMRQLRKASRELNQPASFFALVSPAYLQTWAQLGFVKVVDYRFEIQSAKGKKAFFVIGITSETLNETAH